MPQASNSTDKNHQIQGRKKCAKSWQTITFFWFCPSNNFRSWFFVMKQVKNKACRSTAIQSNQKKNRNIHRQPFLFWFYTKKKQQKSHHSWKSFCQIVSGFSRLCRNFFPVESAKFSQNRWNKSFFKAVLFELFDWF